MADQLTEDRRSRASTIVGVHTRESLTIKVGQGLKGTAVVVVLNRLRVDRRAPKALFCDNGAEFASQIMDLRANENGVKLNSSRPGKPTDNAYGEPFNGTFHTECLDTHWFTTLAEVKRRSRLGGRSTMSPVLTDSRREIAERIRQEHRG